MSFFRRFQTASTSVWIGLCSLALLLPLVAGGVGAPTFKNINNARLQELMNQDVPVYDVRREDEWQRTGVIDGSRLLTFVDRQGRMKERFLPRFTVEIATDQPVIIVCRTGNRSEILARYLTDKLGYTRVYNLRDGIVSWIYEKKPVVNP